MLIDKNKYSSVTVSIIRKGPCEGFKANPYNDPYNDPNIHKTIQNDIDPILFQNDP